MAKPVRIDWHRITFWGSIGVAAVFIGAASFDEDRRVTTIFSQQGRDELKKYVRFNYPETAERWGFNNVAKPPITSSR